MPAVDFTYIVSDDYVELIKKETYEPIILNIINQSKKVFPNKFERILIQNNNESDFIDLTTNEYYDAKILFKENICKFIDKKYLIKWLEEIRIDSQEVYNAIMSKGEEKEILGRLSKNIFYSEMKKRLSKINLNEKCILFFPFPLTVELENDVLTFLFSTKYHLLIRTLNVYEKEVVKDKEIFIIYPNLENKVILRKLFNGIKETFDIEFLKTKNIKKYIHVENLKHIKD